MNESDAGLIALRTTWPSITLCAYARVRSPFTALFGENVNENSSPEERAWAAALLRFAWPIKQPATVYGPRVPRCPRQFVHVASNGIDFGFTFRAWPLNGRKSFCRCDGCAALRNPSLSRGGRPVYVCQEVLSVVDRNGYSSHTVSGDGVCSIRPCLSPRRKIPPFLLADVAAEKCPCKCPWLVHGRPGAACFLSHATGEILRSRATLPGPIVSGQT